MFSSFKNTSFYQKFYSVFKNNFFYQAWKKINNQIAVFIHGNPSKALFVVGVTGTTGKTTTANLIHRVLNDCVAKTLLISGDSVKFGDQEIKNKNLFDLNTYDFQSLLASAVANGCKMAVVEVYGTGLEKLVFQAIEFNMGVLTNMTQDHIYNETDFHDYIKNKEKLFKYIIKNNKVNKFVVMPKDDKIGRKWFDEISLDKKLSFSITNSSMLQASNIIEGMTGTSFTFSYLNKTYNLQTSLLGAFNVYNILATIGAGIQIGINMDKITNSLSVYQPGENKFKCLQENGVYSFLDVSSAPDSLDKTLKFLAHVKNAGKLIVVVGGQGGKLIKKRASIGLTAQRYADILIVTDDTPGKEDRLQIIKQITEKITMKEGENFFVIPDKNLAIKFAKEISNSGDIILVALSINIL